MPYRRLWTATGALLLIVTASGCASKVPVQCPKFQPSSEALQPIQGTGWRPLGERVVETYRDSATISSGRSKPGKD